MQFQITLQGGPLLKRGRCIDWPGDSSSVGNSRSTAAAADIVAAPLTITFLLIHFIEKVVAAFRTAFEVRSDEHGTRNEVSILGFHVTGHAAKCTFCPLPPSSGNLVLND